MAAGQNTPTNPVLRVSSLLRFSVAVSPRVEYYLHRSAGAHSSRARVPMTPETPPSYDTRTRRWLLVGAIIGILAAGAALWSVARPAPVEVIRPRMTLAPEILSVDGVVLGPKQVELTLHDPGIIVQMLVTPGSEVSANQVIARLGSQSGARDLERAEAVVKDARAELDAVRRAIEREPDSTPELAATDTLAQARNEVRRLREEFARLAKEASDSRDAMREMKDATKELESARSRLEIEQAHVDRMTKLRDHARQLMTEGKKEPEVLAQAQLDLDRATRKLEAAKRGLAAAQERSDALRSRARRELGEELEKARRALEDAEARYVAALREQQSTDGPEPAPNILEKRRQALDERLKAALERLERAENLRDQIDASLRTTDVKSPFDGIITEVLRQEGDFVSAESVVLTIAEARPPVARVQVPARDAARIRLGQTARVALRGSPDESFEATVSEVPEPGDEREVVTVTLQLNASADAVEGRKPALADIIVDADRQLPAVAEACLVRVGQEAYVLLVEGGHIRRRPVLPGPRTDEGTAILEGLTVDDLVVLDPLSVKVGARARPVEVKTATEAEAIGKRPENAP
ncbi:MAG: efflux RND transporter periplasmic adaptor subunit [Armatimonadetes bacterium]|nr:efflux RND transporter periplasmic adaptor subunit [Armatimonadota bacterium]